MNDELMTLKIEPGRSVIIEPGRMLVDCADGIAELGPLPDRFHLEVGAAPPD